MGWNVGIGCLKLFSKKVKIGGCLPWWKLLGKGGNSFDSFGYTLK